MARIFLDYKYDNVWNPPGYYLEKAFKSLGHEVTHDDKEQLDLAIFLSPTSRAKIQGVPCFYWEIDSTRKHHNENIGEYDLLFIDNKDQEYYPFSIFLPVGADEEYTRRTKEPTLDVVMIGTHSKSDIYNGYNERGRVMELLTENRYKTFIGDSIYGEDYPAKLSEGRMQLNIAGLTDLSMHFFECLSIGAMLFKENDRYPEIATPDYHYISFKTDEELLEKVDYYLKNPKELELVAQRGREHVLNFHTYKHRAITLLGYL